MVLRLRSGIPGRSGGSLGSSFTAAIYAGRGTSPTESGVATRGGGDDRRYP